MLILNVANEILTPILVALGVGVAGLITWGFTMLQAWVSNKIKDDKIKLVSNTVLDLIRDTVLYVNQVFVDQLKESGGFNKEAQVEAMAMALEHIKANLTAEANKILEDLYGDVSNWLLVQIEAMISKMK